MGMDRKKEHCKKKVRKRKRDQKQSDGNKKAVPIHILLDFILFD